MIGMLGAFGVSGIALMHWPPEWEYHVADDHTRWLACAPILLIILAAKFFFSKNPEWDRPRNFLSAIGIGVSAGLIFSLGIFLSYALEAMNGALDRNASSRSLTVLDVKKYEGSHPHVRLVVKDLNGSNTRSEIFWNKNYPVGWNKAGNCLIANTGPGILGMRWIANERIEPCSGSNVRSP